MKRKLLAIGLGALMAISMAACGSSSSSSTSTASTAATSQAADTGSVVTDADAQSLAQSIKEDAGTTDGSLITVGFSQVGHESDWRTASTNSVKEAFSKDNGFDLQFVDCDNNSETQLQSVRNFIQQQVDYIIIDPIVSTGWDTVLTEAQDADIPVIVIDRTIDDSDKYTAWIGTDTKNEGLAAGAWLKDYAKAKGISDLNILVISGTTGSSAQIGRTEGFDQYVKSEGWNKLDEQTGDFTQDGGQQVMESYCKSYAGKFNVVVCQNDNEAFGAIDAMKAAGVSYGADGDVIVISFDACKAGLQMVLDGDINADFQCNPLQGPDCAKIVKALDAGQDVQKETFMAEPWYAHDDTVKSVSYTNNAGKDVTEDMIVVTQDIVDAGY
ncbi:MAG: ABC transporter substrate-binding protein [Eubacteriales bacterium]|nr:ABC transporter substrate-binding protein [Lachnospiraceae bacterium]MDD5860855.1 ABC transporter substrate-binding protein [Eubacteriales bacterium]